MRQGFARGGASRTRLGGGRVIEPMRLVIGYRATLVKEYYVAEIAIESAKKLV
jgi:S-adenosylmethionine synthetase